MLLSLVLGPVATLAIVTLDRVEVTAPVKREPPATWVSITAGSVLAIASVLAYFGLHH